MRLAFGVALLIGGALLLLPGALTLLSAIPAGYDTTRTGRIIVGLFLTLPGVALIAGGVWLVGRSEDD